MFRGYISFLIWELLVHILCPFFIKLLAFFSCWIVSTLVEWCNSCLLVNFLQPMTHSHGDACAYKYPSSALKQQWQWPGTMEAGRVGILVSFPMEMWLMGLSNSTPWQGSRPSRSLWLGQRPFLLLPTSSLLFSLVRPIPLSLPMPQESSLLSFLFPNISTGTALPPCHSQWLYSKLTTSCSVLVRWQLGRCYSE